VNLREYKPVSQLRVKTTPVNQPRIPVVDAHNHLGEGVGVGPGKRSVEETLLIMDEVGVEVFVDLDGGWGEEILQRNLDQFKNRYPDRFIHFGGVDWSQWGDKGMGFGEWAAQRLRKQVKWGAQGLKIWKEFGLKVRDFEGELTQVDDPRLEPIWNTAAELGIPVMIHAADPVAFFDPIDEYNERWEELQENPDWHFPSHPFLIS